MSKKEIALLITAIIIIIIALIFTTVFICLNGKNHNENDIGEVYFHKTELEHIKLNDDGTLYADNEILLVANDDAEFKDIEKLAKDNDAEIIGYIEQTGDYQLQFNKVYTVDELEEIVILFKQNELIIDAYVNYAFVTYGTKTEERNGFIYGDKWEKDLQNFNNCKGKSWGIEAIETLAAWDVLNLYKSKVNPVKVGLIDSGFDTNHEDLGFAETFYNSSAEAHGTHVAGTIAAKTNNEQGICGVYPYGDGNIYGVSHSGIFNYSENEDPFTTSMFLKIAYAELILRDIRVINSSLGFNYYKWNPVLQYESQEWYKQVDFLESNAYILGDFLNRLLDKGYDFILINAAGNDSNREDSIIYDSKYSWWTTVIDKEDYPDVYNRIVVVGAIVSNGTIRNSSNGGDRVDVYAPGDDIYSTVLNNRYDTMGGTSMAAPHVSGVAAMVWSLNNNLTGAQVKEIVCSSHNSRYSSCDVVDAYIAAQKAASTLGLSNDKNLNNGGILCWVVSAADNETKISNATVTAMNMQTNEEFTTTTDVLGHFELFVPAGKYTLAVHADGYNEFVWPNEKEPYTEPIIVENNKVNYLNDWIKLKVEKDAILSPESAVNIYMQNRNVWMANPAYPPMIGYGYCLLDLDFDGVLELVASVCDGSGRYSGNCFYRINIEKQTVESFKSESDAFSGVDYYLSPITSKLLKNKSNDKMFYHFCDYIRDGEQAGEILYYEIYTNNNKLYENCVFSEYWSPDYSNDINSEIRKYYFDEKEVTRSEYEQKTETFYSKNTDMNLNWECISGSTFDENSYSKQKQLLLDAYRGFSYDGFSFDDVETYDVDIEWHSYDPETAIQYSMIDYCGMTMSDVTKVWGSDYTIKEIFSDGFDYAICYEEKRCPYAFCFESKGIPSSCTGNEILSGIIALPNTRFDDFFVIDDVKLADSFAQVSQKIAGVYYYNDGLDGGHFYNCLLENDTLVEFEWNNKNSHPDRIIVTFDSMTDHSTANNENIGNENPTAEQLRKNILGFCLEADAEVDGHIDGYEFLENGIIYHMEQVSGQWYQYPGTYRILNNRKLIIDYPYSYREYMWSELSFDEFHADPDNKGDFWYFTEDGILTLNGKKYYKTEKNN